MFSAAKTRSAFGDFITPPSADADPRPSRAGGKGGGISALPLAPQVLEGAIAELSASGASATATFAMRAVREAQRRGEPVAWVTIRGRCFYPPDAFAHGVDPAALAVVRVPSEKDIGKAADTLVRSGAFGLVVLDLGANPFLDTPRLTRLLGLARKHRTAIVCLTIKADSAPSLGSLVAVRASVRRTRIEPGVFECALCTLKDRRHPPGRRHAERVHGPAGLR